MGVHMGDYIVQLEVKFEDGEAMVTKSSSSVARPFTWAPNVAEFVITKEPITEVFVKLKKADGYKSIGNGLKLNETLEIIVGFDYLATFLVGNTKLNVLMMLIGSYGCHTQLMFFSCGVVLGIYKGRRSFKLT